jgi:Protein of unknown function (DUF2516)
MLASLSGFYEALIWVGLLIAFVIPLWAIVDVISRPTAGFKEARSSKALWLILLIVTWILTMVVGLVLSIVYLASIRPRVRAVTKVAGSVPPAVA